LVTIGVVSRYGVVIIVIHTLFKIIVDWAMRPVVDLSIRGLSLGMAIEILTNRMRDIRVETLGWNLWQIEL
jgi:hypothetical protein